MNRRLSGVIEVITQIYERQYILYEQLRKAVVREHDAIASQDLLQLVELVDMEKEYLIQISRLCTEQQKLRRQLLGHLPAQQFSLDLLACLAEPDVLIRLEKAMRKNNHILADLQRQKQRNAILLQNYVGQPAPLRNVI